MKNQKIICCLILLGAMIGLFAQTPVIDAKELRKHVLVSGKFDDNEAKIVNGVLMQYVDTLASETVRSTFKNANPFLKDFFSEDFPMSGKANSLPGGIFGSIGGLDVTNIADGLAKFIVKRAKQELSIAFFEKFKKIIDSTIDLQILFPQTSNLFGVIGEEIYDYERYLQNLREAFKEDISALPRNFPGIIDYHYDYFSRHAYFEATLRSGCYVAGELEDQAHPGDILANYPVEYLDSFNKNFKGAIQTLQLISNSLRDTSTKEDAPYWVNIKQVRDLVTDKTTFKIYLGLIYQEALNKYDSIHYNGITLINILKKVADEYDTAAAIYNGYKLYVLRFGEKIDALNKMIKSYSKPAVDSAGLEKYAKYFRASVEMIEYCTRISELPKIKDTKIGNLGLLLQPYFDVTYSTCDMIIDIGKKNYSSAINHAVHIFDIVRVKPVNEQINTINKDIADKIIEKESEKDTQTKKNIEKESEKLISEKNYLTKDLNSVNRVLDRFVKYGGFMASVATAKNSDEVEKSIEAFALPVGSSRIKRESLFNVSLNAYTGFFWGQEKIKGVDSSGKWNSYGITAPVGIAISKGHSVLFFNSNTKTSSSLFISLIDIGALAAFRFTNDSTEKVPTIELKDIISPGIFYSHGIGKTPLSFNIGYQIGPLLRKVNLDVNKKYENKYSRFSVSLCVDIPVFNFYNKPR